jgi:hypothetical protein
MRLAQQPTIWLIWIIATFALCAGCGAGETPQSRLPNTGGAGGGAGGSGPSASSGQCSPANATAPCTCTDGASGRQVCASGQWGACECAAAGGAIPNFAGNARTDITFAWERTATSADLGGCLPGEYEGTFGGLYWSYLATLAPIEELFVPVANIAFPGEPSGFKFTVMPAEGGETVLKIKGRMDGLADGVFPFNSALEGELDCSTKTFSAQIIGGVYSILIDGLLPQSFDGMLWGTYDTRTHTIVDGEWDVKETTGMPPGTLAPMLPREFKRDGFGGFGTWAAALPTDMTDPSIEPCPTDTECLPAQFGPNKLLCAVGFGPPVCAVDSECEAYFPGRGVTCLAASAFSNCFLECVP